jgi:DNA-binding transcriptional regulator GbsR (MarR family)
MSDLDKNGFSEVTKPIETSKPSGVQAVRKYDMFGYVERIPFKGMRKTV